jgi:MFS family permease
MPVNVPALEGASVGSSTQADRQRLVWLVGLSHAANHFLMLIFPAVLLLIQREFGLGFAALGALANAGLLCYGLGALPAGLLADRFGGERVLAIWLFGGAVACLGIALSAHPFTLALGLAALGLFASLHHPAGSGLLAALGATPGCSVARAFGLAGLLGNVGLGSSPLVAAAIGARWGWRQAFLLGAVPVLLLGVALWRQPRLACNKPTGGARRFEMRDLTRPLLLLFALETLLGFIFQGVGTFLPAHLAEHGGIAGLTAAQVTRGGLLASVAYLVGGWGHPIAGRLMARRNRETIFLGATTLATLSLLGMAVTGGLSLVLYSIVFTFTHFGLGTMSNSFIASQTPPHLGGTAFGITFVLALGVGSLASGTMGAVAQRWGLHAVFLGLAAVAVIATAVVALFGAAMRRSR